MRSAPHSFDVHDLDRLTRDRGVSAISYSVVSSLLIFGNPFLLVQVLRQSLGQFLACVRYLARPSQLSHVVVDAPFDDNWLLARGGLTRQDSHSWRVLAQRFAVDMVRVVDGQDHKQDGLSRSDYLSFGSPILSPIAGAVVQVSDSEADQPIAPITLALRIRDLRGNFVVLKDAAGAYCVLAHLQRGSICVRTGDTVKVRQLIGACGNSGFSTQPHLHMHFQTTGSFYCSIGVPVLFRPTDSLKLDGYTREHSKDIEGTCLQRSDLIYSTITLAMNVLVALSVWYWPYRLVWYML